MNEAVLRVLARLGLDAKPFKQEKVIELVKNPLSGAWVTVYSHHDAADGRPSVFACFADLARKQEILAGDDWLKHASSFSPGFCVCADDVTYHDGRDEGYDFIVAEQYFYPLDQAQILVNQEFVMLFELYRGEDGCYYSVDKCGEREKVVDFAGDEVRVRTKYILRFIVAKQCFFVYFVDARLASSSNYPLGSTECISESDEVGGNYHIGQWYTSDIDEGYLLSMLYARSFIEPDDVETCGVWPFDEKNERYPEFVIGERPDGSLVRYTCDPNKLGTYFDKEPRAPHYLTPVFFKPAVLDKYRSSPHFDVSERHISCGSQWRCEIDNVDPDRVMVYLGDLGRDLPESERTHFLSFEMSPVDQRISDEVFKTDLLNMWVKDPSGPVSMLMRARMELDKAWRKRFGLALYRPFHRADEGILEQIHIPSGNGESEFESVTMALTRALVDYIDESALKDADAKGSINKLEAFLSGNDIVIDLKPLRDLQNLRSAGAAHGKGSKYDRLYGDVVTEDHREDAKRLIARLTTMLNELTEALKPADDRKE